MKKFTLLNRIPLFAIACFLLFNGGIIKGVPYIDSMYTYQQTSDIIYGQAVDFAGNVRDLKMDICVPLGDNPGPNGRPLMVFIHGGAFLGGSKNDGNIQRMMHEFAERGYLTAAINYRLGMFQTNSFWNCNITLLGVPWNCLNQQDTTEWFRAVYRGAQDAHGAIRFLTNNPSQYQINPMQVFVVGESAGGFIAMATAYLDTITEKLFHYGALPNALPPDTLYYACVQQYGLDTNIASMRLTRPDLGPIHGTLNPPTQDYRIQAVGNFYGGMMQDLLSQSPATCLNPPALYTFHQFDDLVVPYAYDRIFAGYAYCATLFPWNCAYILNRPFSRGSRAIRDQARALQQASQPAPTVRFDSTTSNLGCNQINVPNVGHSIDNFVLRTHNMAVFFESYIGSQQGCVIVDVPKADVGNLLIYPNPTQGTLRIRTSTGDQLQGAQLVDMAGKTLATWDFPFTPEQQLTLPEGLAHGLYLLRVHTLFGDISKVVSFQ